HGSEVEPSHHPGCRPTRTRREYVAERSDRCLVPGLGVLANGIACEIPPRRRWTFEERSAEKSDDAATVRPTHDPPQRGEHRLMHEQLTSPAVSRLQAGNDVM